MSDENIWRAVGFGLAMVIVLQFVQWRRRRRAAPAIILELLAMGGEWYGLDLVKAAGGRLSRGTVYVDLNQLEVRGLITSRISRWKIHGVDRRVYRLARKA